MPFVPVNACVFYFAQAERKKEAMRREARARILGKRAAVRAKRAGGGRAAGSKPRVIRRAKRDCRVTDARRHRLGAYLFHGRCTARELV